jgi:hypothetical protein
MCRPHEFLGLSWRRSATSIRAARASPSHQDINRFSTQTRFAFPLSVPAVRRPSGLILSPGEPARALNDGAVWLSPAGGPSTGDPGRTDRRPHVEGGVFSMRRPRCWLGGLLGAGIIAWLLGLPGCGNPEEGSAPKLKGSKDEIQKAMFKNQGEPKTAK